MTTKQYLKDKEMICDIWDVNKYCYTLLIIFVEIIIYICLAFFWTLLYEFDVLYPLELDAFYPLSIAIIIILFFLFKYIANKKSENKEAQIKADRGILYCDDNLYIYKDCAFTDNYYLYKKNDSSYVNLYNTDKSETCIEPDTEYILKLPEIDEISINEELYNRLIQNKMILMISGELYNKVLSLIYQKSKNH